MGRLEDRLARAEAAVDATKPYSVPIEVRVHLKHIERERARLDGREPPPYTDEEIAELYREDLETVAGGGSLVPHRDTPGWDQPGPRRLIELWEEGARRRVEMARHLSLREIYDTREGISDELDEAADRIIEAAFYDPHDHERRLNE